MQAAREYEALDTVRQAIAGRPDGAQALSLFDRPDWYDLLHRHCFAGQAMHVLHAVADGAAAWMMLVEQGDRRLGALANWYSFAWSPVFAGASDAATRARLVDQLVRQLPARTAQIDLYPVEQPGVLMAALRRAGWFAVQREMGGRHVLHVGGRSFADYWASRPGRLRALVRRKGRGTPFALTIHREITPALWADYVAVDARSWKGGEPEGGLMLLRAMAERESAGGRLRLGIARQDGRAVAAQLWTIDGDSALIHKLHHDRAVDAASPGTLLSHRMFAAAIDEDRVATIDYGTGDNGYKTDWMEARVPLYRIDAFNPRVASSWLPAARTAISALVGPRASH